MLVILQALSTSTKMSMWFHLCLFILSVVFIDLCVLSQPEVGLEIASIWQLSEFWYQVIPFRFLTVQREKS